MIFENVEPLFCYILLKGDVSCGTRRLKPQAWFGFDFYLKTGGFPMHRAESEITVAKFPIRESLFECLTFKEAVELKR